MSVKIKDSIKDMKGDDYMESYINFLNEKEGQIRFFQDLRISDDVALTDNTDGVYKGTLFEFKLSIPDINKVLFQAIKYLSHLRIKGKNVPKTILLVALNEGIIYKFKAFDFLDYIEQIYFGAASKNNKGFSTDISPEIINYNNPKGLEKSLQIIQDEGFIKIHIDIYDVVGWTNRFYNEHKKATKIALFEELRTPKHFKKLIYPWKGKESDFKYILDLLNDKLNRKKLGAFYTPAPYCKKAVELIRKAIKQIPTGNDYIIVDRCAGTGNLEEFLTDNELSHCIVATYELKEWIVLNERIGDKVRTIIPPNIDPDSALVKDADALSIGVFEAIKPYVEDKNCNIILFENPPYRDSSASDKNKDSKSNKGKFIFEEMKKDLSNLPNSNISTARDISNQFVWSAWKHYLKKENDCYILFSPIKYWKSLGLSNKTFIDGFLFNRKHFHAGASTISCICWKNIDEDKDILLLKAYDIIDGDIKDLNKEIEIKKVHKTLNQYFDKRVFKDDIKHNIFCESNGYERKMEGNSIFNDNIIGYLRAINFPMNPNNLYLTRLAHYGIRGFYLRNDNFIEKLPLFCAKIYPQRNWYEKDIYFTTSDGGDKYTKDSTFLKNCLIYTCLSPRNHCISFEGSDQRLYQNELCFNTDTLASNQLKNYKLSKIEQDLVNLFGVILTDAKTTKNYNPKYKYGTYQIDMELNTFHKKEKHKIYDYPELNTKIIELKRKLLDYYDIIIQPKLFHYQLLK